MVCSLMAGVVSVCAEGAVTGAGLLYSESDEETAEETKAEAVAWVGRWRT